jgi:hypothetical protein
MDRALVLAAVGPLVPPPRAESRPLPPAAARFDRIEAPRRR